MKQLSPRIGAALKHLCASMAAAAFFAIIVFFIWYPYPYYKIAGGQGIFWIMTSVDVVCGPLLTLVVYKTWKQRKELIRDISCIVLLQIIAMGYGMWTMAQARPVFLAFEGSQFRIVSQVDIDKDNLQKAEPSLQHLGYTGPRLIGVRMVKGSDPGFLKSLDLSLRGLPPAFRPERWIAYDAQKQTVIENAKPLDKLKKRPENAALLENAIRKAGISDKDVGYYPLAKEFGLDWIVLVSKKDGLPTLFLPIDSW